MFLITSLSTYEALITGTGRTALTDNTQLVVRAHITFVELSVAVIVSRVAYLSNLVAEAAGVQCAFIDTAIAIIVQLIADLFRWPDRPVTDKETVNAF